MRVPRSAFRVPRRIGRLPIARPRGTRDCLLGTRVTPDSRKKRLRGQLFRLLGPEKGQSLVEFALVAPVLLLMLLGVSDLGRALYYYVTLANATFEGARVAAIPSNSYDQVKQAVQDEASPLVTIQAGNVTIAPTNRMVGQPVTVTAQYGFSAVTPLIGRIWGGGQLQLQSSTTVVVQ